MKKISFSLGIFMMILASCSNSNNKKADKIATYQEHPVAENCCMYHQATGKYKDAPGSAWGLISVDEPGAIKAVGIASLKPKDPLVAIEFARPPLCDYDVLVDILYCGVCHSDIHASDGDWGAKSSDYPYIPGHEVVGVVSQTGTKVTLHHVGDTVGVGCWKGTCGQCEHCKNGEEQYCRKALLTYRFGGGYATNIVVPEKFAFSVPKGLPLEVVGPLLCAGITTYAPVKYADIKKGDKCAVIGYGGLGNMAVKFLLKKGAEVTVFDINTTKKDAAENIGATFVDANDKEAKREMLRKFSFMITTVPEYFDLQPYINMLDVHGNLCCLGLPGKPQPISANSLIVCNRSISGSMTGSLSDHREMLQYCAQHKIFPDVEIIKASEINKIYTKLRTATGNFRYVIDMSTLKKDIRME